MRKRSLLLVAGACVATLSLTFGSALADPTNPTGPRDLAGTGSDTTQGVMNALADVITIAATKVVASYDATGPNPITTKGAIGSAPCTFNRPVGSGAGVDALNNSVNVAHDGCLQFARSSANDASSRPGQNLTYIPFAKDSITYAVNSTGNVSRTLTKAFLQQLYQCTLSPAVLANFHPYLPQPNSGTRKFFMQNYLGIPNPEPPASCVSDKDPTDPTGNTLLVENTGNLLNSDPKAVVPYSISAYIGQVNKAKFVTDVHGQFLLGSISPTASTADAVSPVLLNTTSGAGRDVYNVVPTGQIGAGTETNQVFVGSGSLLCQQTTTITSQGFAAHPNCGDTTIQTP